MAVAGFLYNRVKRYFAEFSERIHSTRSMSNLSVQQQRQRLQIHDSSENAGTGISSTDGAIHPDDELNWYLTLVKGTDPNSQHMLDADYISVSEFNHDGSLFATGDKGGRIVVFRKNED
ncbi:hypothetical protein GJ496_007696, partial [Pomphorhynchus laevis]